jgi:opacity protein-like surface antigen
MIFNAKGVIFLLVGGIAACSIANSASPVRDRFVYYDNVSVKLMKHNHFELIGALGVASLNASNSVLGITSSETDKLVQTNSNSWNAFATQVGLGYVYNFKHALQYTDKTQWFPSIEPQLNVYPLATQNIKGDVLRFQSSAFNQLSYVMPVTSTRLMLDVALTLVSKKKFSIYAIGGIGNAFNRVGYSDADKNAAPGDCLDQRLDLADKNSSDFAWEAGVGAKIDVNPRVAISLEYLYADLGRVSASASGATGTITAPITAPTSFNLRAQSALLGLHLSL